MVLADINGACDVLAGVHDASGGADGFVSVEVDPGLGERHRRHRAVGTRPARTHRPPQPVGEDPRHRGRRPGDRADDRRGTKHQRHVDLQPRPLPGGDGRLHHRPRAPRRRRRDGRSVTGRQRGELLHLPCRHRGRPPSRGDRQHRGAGPARQSGDRPGQARLPGFPVVRSRASAGSGWRRAAHGCSARCGRALRPRIPPIPTPCTSTT